MSDARRRRRGSRATPPCAGCQSVSPQPDLAGPWAKTSSWPVASDSGSVGAGPRAAHAKRMWAEVVVSGRLRVRRDGVRPLLQPLQNELAPGPLRPAARATLMPAIVQAVRWALENLRAAGAARAAVWRWRLAAASSCAPTAARWAETRSRFTLEKGAGTDAETTLISRPNGARFALGHFECACRGPLARVARRSCSFFDHSCGSMSSPPFFRGRPCKPSRAADAAVRSPLEVGEASLPSNATREYLLPF